MIARLSDPLLLPTHIEDVRSPDFVDTYTGARAIPMIYALREEEIVAELRGQRSAADLLAWLNEL